MQEQIGSVRSCGLACLLLLVIGSTPDSFWTSYDALTRSFQDYTSDLCFILQLDSRQMTVGLHRCSEKALFVCEAGQRLKMYCFF